MTVPNIRKLIVTLFMLAGGVVFLLPFVWMLSASFKVEADVFKYPIEWIPSRWNAVDNYREVWFGDHPFWLYYWNSIKVSVGTTLLSCTVSSLAAYGFSKVRFPAGKWLFLVVLATFMVPPQAILVPQFLLYRSIGLFDSHLGLIFLGQFQCSRHFHASPVFHGHSP